MRCPLRFLDPAATLTTSLSLSSAFLRFFEAAAADALALAGLAGERPLLLLPARCEPCLEGVEALPAAAAAFSARCAGGAAGGAAAAGAGASCRTEQEGTDKCEVDILLPWCWCMSTIKPCARSK